MAQLAEHRIPMTGILGLKNPKVTGSSPVRVNFFCCGDEHTDKYILNWNTCSSLWCVFLFGCAVSMNSEILKVIELFYF